MRTFSFAKHTTALALSLLAFCLIAPSLQAQPKIATIDLKKVFDGFYKTKECDTLLQASGADADKVLANMLEEHKKKQQEYNKLIESANDQAVSADEREKRRKSGETKLAELKEIEQSVMQFRRQAETNIMEQKQRMRENILKLIQDVINSKASAGNFTFVFDRSALAFFQTPVLLYTNGQNDLTEEVIRQLNSTAPPGFFTSDKDKEEKPLAAPPKAAEKEEKPSLAPSKATKKK
ncbi:MAG: OmpH family outer membrane protein [Verrucomicrobia bacterium]|nr:OmpH family outer membrane protein [Verrucomicrobiota bacterium]